MRNILNLFRFIVIAVAGGRTRTSSMPSITRVKRIEFSDSSWGPAGSGLLMINAVA
jgi:hypothetical protein